MSVRVGMGDYNICKAPDSIVTLGLGSCVGVVLYDKTTNTAGMLHAMLPDSTRIRNNQNRAKFVDTGLEDLLKLMDRHGVKRENLVAKMAGGAKMFAFADNTEISDIGKRNVLSAKIHLRKYGIPLIAEDTGLNYGRTIEFYTTDSRLEIRAVGKEVTSI